ncbi:DcrB-related protein [Pseudomonas ovata]|uniref:DcrB-related protein n=1 Tax=Pseudomonas ovata TaxID=1839709 RepID=UPI000D69D658|nr:DcrB-related protein [Pseudomonas ovata]
MTYRLNEFSFALPDTQVQDATINILKFGELGTSLIVSRSVLADGETLHSNFAAQLERLGQQVQDLRHEPVQTLHVGLNQEIEAIELRSQFSKGNEKIWQFQLALVLPDTRRMLALSYVKAQPLGAAEAAHWAGIKQSLSFNTVI